MLAAAAVAAQPQFALAGLRADLNAQRDDLNARITGLRTDMNTGFEAIRELLNSVDRRTARISPRR